MHATLARGAAGRCGAAKRTAFAEVKTIQSQLGARASDSRSSSGRELGANSSSGTATGSAPRARSSCDSSARCDAARGTSTRFANSGKSSYQAMCSRNSTARPITTTVGAERPAAWTRAASSERRAVTTRCCGVVPRVIAAAGVAGSRPPAITRAQMSSSQRVPIRITSVSALRASPSQSIWWSNSSLPR